MSTGGTARLIANAGGKIDMSGLTASGMSGGSIEGAARSSSARSSSPSATFSTCSTA